MTAASPAAAASAPAQARTDSLAVRMKTFVASSSPIVDGSVGRPAARAARASARRATVRAFSGSTCRQKWRLLIVYSAQGKGGGLGAAQSRGGEAWWCVRAIESAGAATK